MLLLHTRDNIRLKLNSNDANLYNLRNMVPRHLYYVKLFYSMQILIKSHEKKIWQHNFILFYLRNLAQINVKYLVLYTI